MASNLKELRENEGISQSQLARDLGINTPTLCNYETGKALPSMEDLLVLVRRYQQPIDFGDIIDDYNKELILNSINALASRYPLLSVLHYAIKKVRYDLKEGNPSTSIVSITQELASYEEVPHLLPPDLNRKK